MTWLLGVPALLKRIPLAAWWTVAAVVVVFLWHRAEVREAYRDGYTKATTEIQARIARDKEAQRAREAAATATLNRQRAVDQGAADARTKEIDNATRNLPDHAPSARLHARICLDLRREAKAAGRPEPACDPAQSRP